MNAEEKTCKPFVGPSVGLLGLTSQSKVDQLVLGGLVRAQQVDLALQGGGLVLLRRQTLGGRPLELGHGTVGPIDQGLHKIFSVSRLEMTTI